MVSKLCWLVRLFIWVGPINLHAALGKGRLHALKHLSALQVNFVNVTSRYYEPQATITCQQYVQKIVFGIQTTTIAFQLDDTKTVVTLPNRNAFVENVTDPIDNSTCEFELAYLN